MSKFNHRALILICGLLILAASCRSARENSLSPPPAVATREVADDLGRKISIPAKIERAVSLAPSLTEEIFAVGAGDRLVGVTTYCDYPAETDKIPKIGDTLNPNLENIIALKPQIVFVSTASQMESFAARLEKQNIRVFVTDPQNIEGVFRSLEQIGEVMNEPDKARRLIDELKKRVADTEARTERAGDVKVFVQIASEPLFTVGKTSFITDLIERAGGASLTADLSEAYPKFSKESALALQPEAIILSESADNSAPNDVFKDSPALKNGRVYKIKADLIARPGPRLVDGLELLARALHPASF